MAAVADADRYQLLLKGPGFTVDREVSEAVAVAIFQLTFGHGRTVVGAIPTPSTAHDDRVDLDNAETQVVTPLERRPAKKVAARRPGKRSNFSATKGIDFKPEGEISWKEFADAKNPTTLLEKALVAVYYMRETLGRTVATGDVIAAFDAVGWRNPSDPANNLQQAGSKGWLETKDMTDIRTVWAGEDYVKHDLPKQVKTA